ncbi:thiamine-phosphate kinase [Piscibacillus halophilus]|uniref:Thiamine-monophosphate kinase n=1 Tax=Piscibacillus halophilus TaxID=571933 RepID=A0A1H9G2F3_9BACI|nr:thiamine-phosphate kinase [Piscibacillus halophilus]SEQ44249.1 thiamine-phosphate kinase [Piscibacillus halophilus]
MDEFSFIRAIQPKYYKHSSVIKGIGDDGAVIQPSSGTQLVIATDTMVENVHFSLEYMTFEDVGFRVLAANLSDLAAMGSQPVYYLVNVSSPHSISNDELIRMMNGMKELADHYHMDLIGGDTTSGQELVITVTVFGEVQPNKKRLRSTAQPNDIVFVTGYLGESGYGYQLIQDGYDESNRYFHQRHKRPEPRIDFVEVNQSIQRLCLNDVSDGISSELNEIVQASGVSILINWDRLPIHPSMIELEHKRLEKLVLSTGEDFELVGTCSRSDWEHVQTNCKNNGINVTKIGEVLAYKHQKPTVYIEKNHVKKRLNQSGYQHGNDKGD